MQKHLFYKQNNALGGVIVENKWGPSLFKAKVLKTHVFYKQHGALGGVIVENPLGPLLFGAKVLQNMCFISKMAPWEA